MFLISDLIFIFFSCTLIVCAVLVVLSKHPVFSLLLLVTSFLSASFLLLLLECELLALLFVTIYVGAIAVLFLFAVMMLDFKYYSLQKNTIVYLPIGVLFGSALLFFFVTKVNNAFIVAPASSLYIDGYTNWYTLIDSTIESEALGNVLYSFFVLQFLLAGLILLVVLLGIVPLTNIAVVKKNSTNQNLFKQLSRNSKKTNHNTN